MLLIRNFAFHFDTFVTYYTPSTKYPHLTSHYQPLTTKAFMQIDWFVTLVAITSVISIICVLELHAEKLAELQHILFNSETIKFHIFLPPKADLE